MNVNQSEYNVKGNFYIIRSAVHIDAKNLSEVRWQIDGELKIWTENKGKPL